LIINDLRKMGTTMQLTEPRCEGDRLALAKMSNLERERFEEWMTALGAAHVKAGSPYGEMSLWETTGAECWLDYFRDDFAPEDALAEDLSHAD
jgi:hypothetical protein